MIEIDGSTGEGGGQILRTSLALAMCTGQPFVIDHIRAKRPKPGLMRQHLTCVQAAATVCGASVDGAELGSQTLVFEPGPVRSGQYAFSVGTAGSCTLVLQTVLPALMLADAPSRVALSGERTTRWRRHSIFCCAALRPCCADSAWSWIWNCVGTVSIRRAAAR